MQAIAYCRFSSNGQREESIDAQMRAINEYADKNNITIIKFYTDRAESATTDNRTDFQNMFNFIEYNTLDIKYVLIHKFDRVFRDRYDSAVYKRKLKLKGMKFISVLEPLDDSPESVILESVLEGMSEYYSKNLAREVMKGMKENAHKAKFNGGIPPYGYTINSDKEYEINPSEAIIVRQIFENFAKGIGYKSISTELNKSSINAILRNDKYIGRYTFNKTHNIKTESGKKIFKKNPKEKWITIENAIPAIVDYELFMEVQQIMDNNSRNFRSFNTHNVYLLSGKLYCGKCNAVMIGKTRANGKGIVTSSYACGGRNKGTKCDMKEVKKETIENIIIEHLEKEIFNKKSIDTLINNIDTELSKFKDVHKDDLQEFEKELKETDKQLNNIVNAIANGMFNTTMKDKMSELEEKKNNLIIMIEEEKIKVKSTANTDVIKNELLKVRNLKELGLEQQKKIIQFYVKKITAQADGYEITTNLNVVTVEHSGSPLEYTMTTFIKK